MTAKHNKRLLLELEKIRRDINRDIMGPVIPALSLDSMRPLITLAAQARLAYLQVLMDFAKGAPEVPSHEQITLLGRQREAYEELRAAVNALETAIDRGYLDVVEPWKEQ